MNTQATFYGGSRTVTIAADTTMAVGLGRVWIVSASSTGLKLKLPAARFVRTGYPVFMVVNDGANAFDLVDNGNNVQRTMAPGDAVTVGLSQNTTSNGEWHLHVGTANSIPDPPTNLLCYLFGGITTNAVDEYDQQLEVWATKTAIPGWADFFQATGAVVGAKAYLAGGSGSTTDNRNLEYDPDTWVTKANAPDGSSGVGIRMACGIAIGTSAYHFNGDTGGDGQGKAYEYVPGSESWTVRSQRPSARDEDDVGCGTNAGKAYLAGGRGASSTNAVDEYVVDTWTAKTNRPAPFAWRIGVTTGDDDLIYVYCGGTASAYFDGVTRFDPVADAWTTLLNFPRGARRWVGATAVGTNNHLFGGRSSAGVTGVAENTEHAIGTDTYVNKPDIPRTTCYQCVNQAKAVTR